MRTPSPINNATTLCRLLGLGKLPARERKSLEAEGILIACEGIAGSLTYRNYRAPGKYFLGRKVWFIGSLAITRRRVVAYAFSRRVLNLPISSGGTIPYQVSVEGGKRLCLAGEISDFAKNQSGRVEFRFSLPDASRAAEVLVGQ